MWIHVMLGSTALIDGRPGKLGSMVLEVFPNLNDPMILSLLRHNFGHIAENITKHSRNQRRFHTTSA